MSFINVANGRLVCCGFFCFGGKWTLWDRRGIEVFPLTGGGTGGGGGVVVSMVSRGGDRT